MMWVYLGTVGWTVSPSQVSLGLFILVTRGWGHPENPCVPGLNFFNN